jgi:hypothetical protein
MKCSDLASVISDPGAASGLEENGLHFLKGK